MRTRARDRAADTRTHTSTDRLPRRPSFFANGLDAAHSSSMEEELQELVGQGLRMTDERLQQSPELSLYRSIRAQLEFIQVT